MLTGYGGDLLQVWVRSLKLARMRSSQTKLRWMLVGPYWVIASFIVFVFYFHDSFCARPGSRNYSIMVVQLGLALAAWDFVAGFVGALASTALEKMLKMRGISLLITTLVVGAGFAYLPLWMYRGYGVFRFENTWADVSCFFTEAYALGFLYFVVPLLALITFLRELLILRLLRQRT
jgi:hypothetical protein